jgi:hypothetical protein
MRLASKAPSAPRTGERLARVAGADILPWRQRVAGRKVGGSSGVGHALTAYRMPIEGRDEWIAAVERFGMRDGHLRGALARQATQRQVDILAAFVDRGRAQGWLLMPSLEPRTTASSAEAAGVVE